MQYYVVDAFTSKPYHGNPAAVVILEKEIIISYEERQDIALEFDLPITCFVTLCNNEDEKKKDLKCKMSWFTRSGYEPILCGHGAIAASHMLFNNIGIASPQLIEFETKHGIVTSRKENRKIVISLDCSKPEYLSEQKKKLYEKYILGATQGLPYKNVFLYKSVAKLLIQIDDNVSRKDLESLTPDLSDFGPNSQQDFEGIIVTTRSFEEEYDFYSRYFAPWIGLPEDHVCGSAHAALGPFWAEILGKTILNCHQCSRRGGDLNLRLKGDRIELAGECVTTMEGKLL